MGLDTTHDAWHGAYSSFMTWRNKIAELAGMPPLQLMEGFYDPLPPNVRSLPTLHCDGNIYSNSLKRIDELLPIKWECLKPSPLHLLLYHSDCDGDLKWETCIDIAVELEKILPLLPNENAGGHIGNWTDKTKQFINGLRKAYEAKEDLIFH